MRLTFPPILLSCWLVPFIYFSPFVQADEIFLRHVRNSDEGREQRVFQGEVFPKTAMTNSQQRVLLPVENPTKSFWLHTPGANPPADEGSTGPLTNDADVCIIGSGITGVSAAWHLSKVLAREDLIKMRVVILEAREFCSGATGRNGGHLTRNAFSSFLKRQERHNTSEALKSYLLEQYTSDALVQFITDRKLENTVDLVEGGHIGVFRTEDEEQVARRDYEAARAAGVGTGNLGVRWIANEELTAKYGLNPELNYTGVYFAGHNLWPSKLVTELFLDAQKSSKNVDVFLHIHTPVTSFSKVDVFDNDTLGLSISDEYDNHRSKNVCDPKRWTLQTPRGAVSCSYVIHATNAYAGHLLPFLSDRHERMEPSEESFSPPGVNCPAHPSPLHPNLPHPERKPPPINGLYSIVPIRGQVGAVRASVDASQLGWLNSWDGGGGGWEYWFPRYQESPSKHPLIILGGARQRSGGDLEMGVTDDSELNPLVSRALRNFLPEFLPGQFDTSGGDGSDGWEMEWTGIMGFTKTGAPFVGPVSPLASAQDLAGNLDYYEGHYIAAGYTGHGMPRAYACAEAVASMIRAKIVGQEWRIPEWLPEQYLTWATPCLKRRNVC
ncbi:hypothetical protein M413DRAFT_379691 [Hebeloma cylindrosporum]|uniref:FAD dependent oxidoreductase domain-containing protein n=1 Tax=Hebeloma cylindrosporum TaxID=76867 RepID=A0A0C2YTL7_HEBCY|nr:hypothetical protein M413DRAFT_379691 [Hebeloma cylindrosporum h7]